MSFKKTMIAFAMIAIMLVSSTVVLAVNGSDSSDATDETTPVEMTKSDVRLQIYGNANGDDVIDAKDVDVLNKIINDSMTDWSTYYPYADANQDGAIDSKDVTVVNNFINKVTEKMYYDNFKGRVCYVFAPISDKICCDYSSFELLSATHSFDKLVAIDQSAKIYSGKYDAITQLVNENKMMTTDGNSYTHTVDSIMEANNRLGVGTLVQWTGGTATDYVWDLLYSLSESDRDAVLQKVSVVSLTIQGPNCIRAALMFACMRGDQSLSDDYKAWYDGAIDMFSAIGTTIEKKTILAIRCFESDKYGTYRAYGGSQSPALWFNQVFNFVEAYQSKTGFTALNSFDELVTKATDEIVLMTQRRNGTTYDAFDSFAQERMYTMYKDTTQYANKTIYMIEWEAMPFFSGPAGCYILAAYLYPDYFKLTDALDFLQTYLDKFSPNEDADAYTGFTYTRNPVLNEARAIHGEATDASNITIEIAEGKSADATINASIASLDSSVTEPNFIVNIDTTVDNLVSLTVGKDTVKNIIDANGKITVSGTVGKVSVSKDYLVSLGYANDVTVSLQTVDTSAWSAEKKALVGDRPVYEISAADGTGSITATVAYELGAGEKASGLKVCFINGEALEEVSDVSYNSLSKTLSFTTSHNSEYVVMYEEPSDDDDDDNGDLLVYVAVAVVAIVIIAAAAVFLRKRSA